MVGRGDGQERVSKVIAQVEPLISEKRTGDDGGMRGKSGQRWEGFL
jgi:hypothetical protein